MNTWLRNPFLASALLTITATLVSCGKPSVQVDDPRLSKLGNVEVTAKLVEIPEGAIFKRDLYNYATILKYEVLQVHRMALEAPIDDYFMGGIVNKYFGQETGPLYWAVWTNPAN